MEGNLGTRIGRKVRLPLIRSTLVLLIAASLAACDPGTAPQFSTVKVLLTDAPADVIASAEVWISQVYLQGVDDSASETATEETPEAAGRVDLFNDPENPLLLDLLTLQNGITADITDAIQVNAGLYEGLRLVVDSARVTLTEGTTFEDGENTATLFVPSGSQSGIKVQLNDVVDAQDGETTTIVVDFDVQASFNIQESQSTGMIRRIILNPVLKELRREKDQG
jgi:hypothetical protein